MEKTTEVQPPHTSTQGGDIFVDLSVKKPAMPQALGFGVSYERKLALDVQYKGLTVKYKSGKAIKEINYSNEALDETSRIYARTLHIDATEAKLLLMFNLVKHTRLHGQAVKLDNPNLIGILTRRVNIAQAPGGRF